MSAIRLARAATGREKVLKFAGAYHGHVDGLLARSRLRPCHPGNPRQPGRSRRRGRGDDRRAVERRRRGRGGGAGARARGDPRRAVPREHGAGPAGAGVPRATCARCAGAHGACSCSTRSSPASASRAAARRSCRAWPADLTVMGKVIGGGLPAAAFGGRRELMERIAPAGDVYQAGTLSGNPLAVAAGLATLRAARRGRLHAPRRARPSALADGPARGGRERRRAGPGGEHDRAADGLLLRRRPCATTPARRPATSRPTAPGAGRCSPAACTRRRRSSRPGSPRWPTPTSRSIARVAAAARRLRGGRAREAPSTGAVAADACAAGAACSRRPSRTSPTRAPTRARRRWPPRARAPPGGAREYALLVEAIREGYLLHYGAAAWSSADDADLALLAGDQLYALGLARLAELGDLEAVAELADVITLPRPPRRRRRGPGRGGLGGRRGRGRLGATPGHAAAKALARAGDPGAAEALRAAARAARQTP